MFSVVIADDEPMALYALKGALSWEQYHFSVVYETTNSKEALNYLLNHDVDVAFLDIRMPEYSGLDIIKECNDLKGNNTLFVIITGYTDFEYLQTAIRSGVFDYCLKPIDKIESNNMLARIQDIVMDRRIINDHQRLEKILSTAEQDIVSLLRSYNLNVDDKYFRIIYWRGNFINGFTILKEISKSICTIITSTNQCIFIASQNDVDRILEDYETEEIIVITDAIHNINNLPKILFYMRTIWEHSKSGINTINISNMANDNLRPILEYIDKNLAEDISLNDISKLFNYNYSYCSELFQNTLGISFKKYLLHQRIDKACTLLKSSNKGIESISELVGFHNYHYFANVFKEVIGSTPSEYRKKSGRQNDE